LRNYNKGYSNNDAAFAVTMAGNPPTDPPSAAYIIDFPANFHNGAAGFSFTDGHSEVHKWIGSKIAKPRDLHRHPSAVGPGR